MPNPTQSDRPLEVDGPDTLTQVPTAPEGYGPTREGRWIGKAPARAGLAGNPSDGYFGKTVSVDLPMFGATVELTAHNRVIFQPGPEDRDEFISLKEMDRRISLTGYQGGVPLLKATARKFFRYVQATGQGETPTLQGGFEARYETDIPRQVGLAGSSALVVAMLRALCARYAVTIPAAEMASLALAVETEEMGITAGLQDRVIQCMGGCVHMDFNEAHQAQYGYGVYTPLPAGQLPRLYVAYNTDLAKVSGKVLNQVRERYLAGDRHVIDTLAQIASQADAARQAIEAGDVQALGKAIDTNLELRRQIMTITPANEAMIQAARKLGLSAGYTGSGGAIVGVLPSMDLLPALEEAMAPLRAAVAIRHL